MIRIERLTKENFREDSLDSFERRQDVKRMYRLVNGECILREEPYVEDWTLERKRMVARDISGEDYLTYLALDGKTVVGFIGLIKELCGNAMILDYIHVAASYRGQGIGRQLFCKGREEAAKVGADDLYICACPSEETIAFYKAMGAELTEDTIPELVAIEPLDLQLRCPM